MTPKPSQLSAVNAHEGEVNCVSLGTKTGMVYATGGEDRILNLWVTQNKKPRLSFGPFQSSISVCRFNDTEDKILCGNNGGTVLMIDLNNSRTDATWAAHRSTVNDVCFHTQNNNMVLTCGYDGKLNILSKQQRHPSQCYTLHKGSATSVDITSDGRYAATCGVDKTVRIYDLVASKELCKFTSHSEAVNCVKFHPFEPILASCSEDRSIHFYDLYKMKELQTSFPLDTDSISLIRYAPMDQCMLTLSKSYSKIIGWSPPTFYEQISTGIDVPQDLAIIDGNILFASSSGNLAIIHKLKCSGMKPFIKRKRVYSDSDALKKEGSAKILDEQHIPATKGSSRSESAEQSIDRYSSRGESNVSKERIPAPNSVSTSGTSVLYAEFRKERANFMTSMNERFSKLTRINEELDQMSLIELLNGCAENGKYAAELLTVMQMKPEVLSLQHAASIMQISTLILKSNTELAVTTIESMLQSFGKLIHATLQTPNSGVDLALEERKKRCTNFVNAFKQMLPALKQLSGENTPSGITAAEIISEWKVFAK